MNLSFLGQSVCVSFRISVSPFFRYYYCSSSYSSSSSSHEVYLQSGERQVSSSLLGNLSHSRSLPCMRWGRHSTGSLSLFQFEFVREQFEGEEKKKDTEVDGSGGGKEGKI